MLRKALRRIVYALVLLSACLSMVANAKAGTKTAGTGPVPITNTEIGSGR